MGADWCGARAAVAAKHAGDAGVQAAAAAFGAKFGVNVVWLDAET
jgi:hypothetical protein